jgi:hypothetical protein
VTDAPRSIGFRRAALHLGGLWALAFAQPLFDLLGRNAQFFVARGSTRGDILLLAFGYVLIPPLLGALLVWALGRVRPGAGWAAMLVLVAVLVAALVLPPLGDALDGSAGAIVVGLAVGALAAALYARVDGVQSFVGVLAVAPVVVVALFLLASPVRELLLPGDGAGTLVGPPRSSTPIVHVVLDELPEETIDAGDGTIDATLFPNLARLARTSTWYRNATTVDDLTAEAVPAQLTGEKPEAGDLPTVRDHPRNLFTLFGRSHDLIVVEPITDLCPERLCNKARLGTLPRLDALREDLTIVAGHLLLPDDLRDGLPAVDGAWEDFDPGTPPGSLRGGKRLKPGILDRLAHDDATAGFQRAMAALGRPRTRPPLVFVHSTLPHGPWRYLPDGRQYEMHRKAYPGLEEVWGPRQWLADQAFQRHVLQARYADRLVGALMRRLRETGLFDRAVIVVAADHGVSVRAGEPRRPATPRNVQDIAPVPFFVKLPGQRRGRVDDRAVRTVDALPTIAKAAGVRVPWDADGRAADERPVDRAAPIDISHAGVDVLTVPLAEVLRGRREREEDETRLLRHGVWGVGPRLDLLGRRLPVAASTVPGGPRATVDAPDDYAGVDPTAPFVPVFVTGRVEGLAPDAEMAIAVNGRVEATTRAYPAGRRMLYGAVVPPSSLRRGPNVVTVLQVLPGGALRAIGGAGSGR